MKHDELIDDIARQMTAVDERPALREQVLAGIDATPAPTRHAWWVPTTAAAAVAMAVLVWLFTPNVSDRDTVPTTVAQHDPALAPEANDRRASSGQAEGRVDHHVRQYARVTRTRPIETSVAEASPVDALWTEEWTGAPTASIPTLPALPDPEPLAITAIATEPLTIAPLNVAAVELESLVINPLDSVLPVLWRTDLVKVEGL